MAARARSFDDRILGTIDMQVHYLQRAAGGALVAEGRPVSAIKAIAVACAEVRDDASALFAIGAATYRPGDAGKRRNED